jgi:tetratricopeptide (TPR) repeat protein
LEHLPDLSREVLHAAAIVGRDFDFETLLLVSKLEEGALINALDNAERAQIIHEVSSQSGGTFSFVHALIPATILEDMSNLRRRHLHLQAAQAIQAHSPEKVDSLAYHFYEAGDKEGARDFFIQAGDQAREILALDVAISNYRKALEGFTENMTAGRINILQKIAYGLLVIGRQDDALPYLTQALALCAETGDIQQAGVTERLIARVHWELGDRPEALNHYHQSLAHLESLGDSKELARTVSTISQMHMLASEYQQAIEWGERALELADRFKAEDVTVHALNNIGVSIVATKPDEHDRGISFLEESLQRSIDLNLPHDALRAYNNISEYYLALGYYDQLETLFPEAIHYATEINASWFRDTHIAKRSQFYWRIGRWKEALIFKDQITAKDFDYTGFLIEIDIDLGKQQTALERLDRFREIAFQRNEIQTLIPYLGLIAIAHLGLNQPQEASLSYQMILERLQKSPYVHRDCPSPLRDGCKYFAFEIQSIDKAKEFLDLLSRCHNQLNTPVAKYSFYEGQGVVHHASGELSLAVEHYKKALKGWESLEWPMNQIYTLYYLSKTQKDLKHLSEAHESLVQAAELISILENQIEDQNLRKSFRKTNIVVNIFESKNAIERDLGM